MDAPPARLFCSTDLKKMITSTMCSCVHVISNPLVVSIGPFLLASCKSMPNGNDIPYCSSIVNGCPLY